MRTPHAPTQGTALTGRSKAKDMLKLSNLGHYLKGSSAALGVTRVQASCERIQHYGKLWDEDAGVALTQEQALRKIEALLKLVKVEYAEAEKWFRAWYEKQGITAPTGSPED